MDEFDLNDNDLEALLAPECTSSWLASFDNGLRRAGVSVESVSLRHKVDRVLLDDTRVSAELRQRAGTELLDDATTRRLASQRDRAEELTLAWVATLMAWAAQYEVLAAVGELDEEVFLKAATYAMNAIGFPGVVESAGSPDIR